MAFDDYKVVLYRNQPDGWVAEVPAIPGCYALMPTREEALAEMAPVFEMIAAEYREKVSLCQPTPPKSCMPSARDEFSACGIAIGIATSASNRQSRAEEFERLR